MDDEGKVRILAWRQKKSDHKKIYRRTKRARSSVMVLLAAARDLHKDAIPATKSRSEP